MVIQTEQIRRLQINRPESVPTGPSKHRKRAVIGALLALFALLSFLAWRWMAAAPAIDVETVRATAEAESATGVLLSASGYIVAHHRIDVNSKVTGRVAWIGVEKGDHVKEGQVLVRLEDSEFRAQQAQAQGEVASAKAHLNELLAGSRPEEIKRDLNALHEAEATLANDRKNYERIKGLYTDGITSKQQLDEAESRYQGSVHRVESSQQTYQMSLLGPRKEEVDRARGDLQQAEGKLAFSRSQLNATEIRAPVGGTILERTAEKGELVTAQFASGADTGGPRGSVVVLADLSDLQAQVDVSQDDFSRIGNARKALVFTDAYPDKQFDGVIAEIAPEANRQKATVEIRIKILRPDETLRPEMNANVNFLAEGKSKVSVSKPPIEVPFSAVVTRNGRKTVIIVANNKAVETQVHLLGKKTSGYLVDGISEGDLVVIDPAPALKTGDRVKLKSQQ